MKRTWTRRALFRRAALVAGLLTTGAAQRLLDAVTPPLQAQTLAATTQSIPLQAGWNLLSLPVAPAATAPSEILSSLAGHYRTVFAYDAAAPSNPWRCYAPANPPYANDLTALSPQMGFWLEADQAAQLAVTGMRLASSSMALYQGWNLVGYPFRQALPVATALTSIGGSYDQVYGYDAARGANPWRTYTVGQPPEVNDLVEMQPGQGYWVHVAAPCALVLPPLLVTTPRVVHIHAPAATHWDFSTGWYGEHVSPAVVNQMMERGLLELTGAASVAAAWGLLLPAYEPGQKIAVKINLNNAVCNESDNVIDALIEPINALLTTLVNSGIREEDIWVYDAIRPMPTRIYGHRAHTRARYLASACADGGAPFTRMHPSLKVTFNHPAMVTERYLTDLLYQASYVINMPIIKLHGTHPVTLGFKNHFGSLNNLGGAGEDNPHLYIQPSNWRYQSGFSPLVDINANPNIASKTVLTIGDGLYGASHVNAVPARWRTFGNQAPNSLFFSRDRVAIDCVMMDLLRAEWGLDERAYDYLRLAQQRSLGVFERGEPWGSGYRVIDYRKVAI